MYKSVIVLFVLPLTLLLSCNKSDSLSVNEMLVNDYGWMGYEHKRISAGEEDDIYKGIPFIILTTYGHGFKLEKNGDCFVNFSEPLGIKLDETDVSRTNGTWRRTGIRRFMFFSENSSVGMNIRILKLTKDFLWIRYEQSGYILEHKLRRLE